jgi:hypothetical protein
MADEKLTDLTALDAFASGDLLYTVDDPVGTPVSKKATIDQVQDYIEGAANTFTAKQTIDLAGEQLALGGTNTGVMSFAGTTSGKVTLQAADAAGTYTLTLPTNDGDSGQFLKTDGSGVLSWDAAGGGGTPGGSDTQVQFNDGGAFGGDSGFTFNKTSKAVTLGGATVTTDAPVLNLSQTWNDAAVTFTGLKFNATDTASNAASLLMDLRVGDASVFNVKKNGDLKIGTANTGIRLFLNNSLAFFTFGSHRNSMGDYGTAISNVSSLSFANAGQPTGSNSDTFITRKATANLRLGAADAAAPVAQTLSVQSVVAGTTDTAGANLTIAGSQGTGTGAGGSIVFQVAPAGTTGTAQNALSTALTIGSDRSASFASGASFVNNVNNLAGYICGNTSGFQWSGRSRLSSAANGDIRLGNAANNDFNLLQFGGLTSSFPALKRSTTSLQARLADDSAFTNIQGKLTTETAYTAGAPSATGYIVLYDSTGTAYKVPAEAL